MTSVSPTAASPSRRRRNVAPHRRARARDPLPGDEAWEKLPFYAAHHVDEILIVDPDTRHAHWLALTPDRYEPIEHSALIELGPSELAQRIDWP